MDDDVERYALEQDAETLANLRRQLDFVLVMVESVDPEVEVPMSSLQLLVKAIHKVAYAEED